MDPDSFAVLRIDATLANPMDDVLLQLHADVTYDAVKFAGAAPVFWLPVKAVIEAATKRQHWRNTHVFAGYRRFNVETEVRTADPK